MQSKEMEARGEESRLLLEKEIYARDNAIRDREQALDSLSRTAITLQDYKVPPHIYAYIIQRCGNGRMG
jgi:hypothetical protein